MVPKVGDKYYTKIYANSFYQVVPEIRVMRCVSVAPDKNRCVMRGLFGSYALVDNDHVLGPYESWWSRFLRSWCQR